MKIGSEVKIADCNFYDADGLVVGETKSFWRVKIFNHRTMNELWANQKEDVKLFHKKAQERGEHLERGFYKHLNNGSFCAMFEANKVLKK